MKEPADFTERAELIKLPPRLAALRRKTARVIDARVVEPVPIKREVPTILARPSDVSGSERTAIVECSRCHYRGVQSLASVYGHGTSTSVSLKGLVFKHAYTKIRRQSELAKECAPPKKKRFWLACFLLMLTAGRVWFWYKSGADPGDMIQQPTAILFLLLAWVGVFLTVRNGLWNRKRWPALMDDWGRLVYCPRCNTISRITDIATDMR
jgi:hypothetical protein